MFYSFVEIFVCNCKDNINDVSAIH